MHRMALGFLFLLCLVTSVPAPPIVPTPLNLSRLKLSPILCSESYKTQSLFCCLSAPGSRSLLDLYPLSTKLPTKAGVHEGFFYVHVDRAGGRISVLASPLEGQEWDTQGTASLRLGDGSTRIRHTACSPCQGLHVS